MKKTLILCSVLILTLVACSDDGMYITNSTDNELITSKDEDEKVFAYTASAEFVEFDEEMLLEKWNTFLVDTEKTVYEDGFIRYTKDNENQRLIINSYHGFPQQSFSINLDDSYYMGINNAFNPVYIYKERANQELFTDEIDFKTTYEVHEEFNSLLREFGIETFYKLEVIPLSKEQLSEQLKVNIADTIEFLENNIANQKKLPEDQIDEEQIKFDEEDIVYYNSILETFNAKDTYYVLAVPYFSDTPISINDYYELHTGESTAMITEDGLINLRIYNPINTTNKKIVEIMAEEDIITLFENRFPTDKYGEAELRYYLSYVEGTTDIELRPCYEVKYNIEFIESIAFPGTMFESYNEVSFDAITGEHQIIDGRG